MLGLFLVTYCYSATRNNLVCISSYECYRIFTWEWNCQIMNIFIQHYSRWLYLFTPPEFQLPCNLSNNRILRLLNIWLLCGWQMIPHCDSFCVSLINEVKHVFLGFFGHLYFSLMKYLFRSFVSSSFAYWFLGVLNVIPMSVIRIANIFFQFVACLYTFFVVTLE